MRLWPKKVSTPEMEATRGYACLKRGQIPHAQGHLDGFVRTQPARAIAVALECERQHENRLAQHFFGQATAEVPKACWPALLLEVGRDYAQRAAACGRQAGELECFGAPAKKIRNVRDKATHFAKAAGRAFLRAEDIDPNAYAPHANRLRCLLEHFCQTNFRRSWCQVQTLLVIDGRDAQLPQNLDVPKTFRRQIDVVSTWMTLHEICTELAATQSLLPFANELLTVGLLLGYYRFKTLSKLSAPVLPVVRTLLLAPDVQRDLMLEQAALFFLVLGGYGPSESYPLLREYHAANRVDATTVDAFLAAYVAAGEYETNQAIVDTAATELLDMIRAAGPTDVTQAVLSFMFGERDIKLPQPKPSLPISDPLVILDDAVAWHTTPLAPAISPDHVLHLHKLRAEQLDACAASVVVALRKHMSAEQQQALEVYSPPSNLAGTENVIAIEKGCKHA